jgi:hypothetical protein
MAWEGTSEEVKVKKDMEEFMAHLRVLLMTTILLKRQFVYRTLFSHFTCS